MRRRVEEEKIQRENKEVKKVNRKKEIRYNKSDRKKGKRIEEQRGRNQIKLENEKNKCNT